MTQMNSQSIKPAVLLILRNLAIIVVALLLLLAVVFLFPFQPGSPRPFDREIWKHQEDSSERLRMVEDLKPKLMGLSSKEVEQLLGSPRTDVGENPFGYDYAYLLGTYDLPVLGPIDGIWLCIKLAQDRVIDVQVIRD